MITLNSNAESQIASNQQEMPEIFFFNTFSKSDSYAKAVL